MNMRNYLIFSSSAHIIFLAIVFFLTKNSFSLKKQTSYYIDFIGGSTKAVTMETSAAAPPKNESAETAKTGPKTAQKTPAADESQDFAKGTSKPYALPKPSVLSGSSSKLFDEEAPKSQSASGDGSSDAPIAADFSNFPYPWYITQVREALWNSWSAKMPSAGALKCVVRFDINRDGRISGVSVEKSSGNRLFDYAAETSVQGAAPFEALPDDFYEDKLTVHVEFKAID